MITYRVGNISTQVRQWLFPDSCVGIDLQLGSQHVEFGCNEVHVKCIFGANGFTINDDLIALAFVRNALRTQYPVANIHLSLPYIPYARQDRAVNPGESASLKVIGNLINSMNFASVRCVDAHSTVAAACIDRLYVEDQYSVFNGVRKSFRETYIVAPDQGASKKCEDFAKRVDAAGVITCAKNRDLKTGKIIGFRVIDDVPPNADLLVLDDIADGCGTFVLVANEIRKHEPARLDLAITHGLFTKGSNIVTDVYDKVFTSNSFISDKSGVIVIDL